MTRFLPEVRSMLLDPLVNEFDRFYSKFMGDQGVLDGLKGSGGYPKLDALEKDGYFYVHASVPGVETENLTVEVEDGVLRINGKMSEDLRSEGAAYHVREMKSSRFMRQFTLPEYVEGDPEAILKNGVLTLKWKVKQKEIPLPPKKRIAVKKEE